jgi:hypothetical protein
MQNSITPYTSLITVCSYALDELDKSSADLDKFWLLGHRALTQLNYSFSGKTKTIRQPLLGNKTAPLPPDCISWTKIGILDNNGQINTLRINNSLITFRDTNPDRLQDLTADVNNSIGNLALVPYYSNYYYGGGVYQLFGVGNGIITYGECKVDEPNRIIIFSPDFKYDAVMIEYVSSPELDYDYQVPSYLNEAIIAFIKWKLKVGSYQEWVAAQIIARRSVPKKKFVLQSFNQVIRDSNGMKLRS